MTGTVTGTEARLAGGGAVPDWLAHRAAGSPERTALLCDEEQLTFAALDERVTQRALGLLDGPLAPGTRAGLLMRNGTGFVEAVHAVPRAGGVLVPLNRRLTTAELGWQLRDASCSVLLHDEEHGDTAKELAASVPGLACIAWPDLQTAPPARPRPGASLLKERFPLDGVHSILYTSGTTGTPKGAMLTFGNHLWSALSSVLNLGLVPGDRWLACLPLFHVGGFSILLRSALYGIPVVLHPSFDAAAVNRSIVEDGVSIISVVSTMLRRMLAELGEGGRYPSSLRCVLAGGGPVPRPLLEDCRERGIPVVQTYGLTETASQVVTLAPAEAIRKLGSAGKPLFPTEVRIEREGRTMPAGEPGEILVRGPTVTPGYDRRPEATAAALRGGWLHTGDWGYLDEEGFLFVLDRRQDLIVSGGENVYPAEVEAALLAHPGVSDAGVAGVPDDEWGQVPAAAVVCKAAERLSEADLKDFLSRRLARYKQPAFIRFVPALPRTASGKLQRHRIAALFRADGTAAPADSRRG